MDLCNIYILELCLKRLDKLQSYNCKTLDHMKPHMVFFQEPDQSYKVHNM